MPRDCLSPEKVEWLPESLPPLTDEVLFPVRCKSVKTERNGCFIKCTDPNTVTRHMKKKGNMDQSKEQNKSPQTNPQ